MKILSLKLVIIIEHQNIIKGYIRNQSEEVFVIKNVKKTFPWTYVISDLNGEENFGTFYEKDFEKLNQKEFRVEKVMKRIGDKLYLKWKEYHNSFNSWINKKDIV